jgi:hypothetical protein
VVNRLPAFAVLRRGKQAGGYEENLLDEQNALVIQLFA